MYSRRLRTVRCSSRLLGGVFAQGGVYPGEVDVCPSALPLPRCEQNDRQV